MSVSIYTNPNRWFDHLVLLVADLDAAAREFTDKGFSLTNVGRHPSQLTANRLIMFDDTYLELLAVEEPTLQNAYMRDRLAAGLTLAGIALPGDDVEASARRAEARGFSVRTTPSLERPTSRGIARFGLAMSIPDDATLPFQFICRHFTPELVWTQPPYRHPNGVNGIASIEIATSAVEPSMLLFSALVGRHATPDHLQFVSAADRKPRIGLQGWPNGQWEPQSAPGLRIWGAD